MIRDVAITESEQATVDLGARLAGSLEPGAAVLLEGELGAGKTAFVRGLAIGLGAPEEGVSSPTFTLIQEYRGRMPFLHADLYRISDEDELYGTGFFDLLGGEGAVLVEWADRIPGALPAERLEIRLRHGGRAPDVRHLEIEGTGARHAALARALAPRPLTPARSPAKRGRGGKGPRARSRPRPRPR